LNDPLIRYLVEQADTLKTCLIVACSVFAGASVVFFIAMASWLEGASNKTNADELRATSRKCRTTAVLFLLVALSLLLAIAVLPSSDTLATMLGVHAPVQGIDSFTGQQP
jgi:hypothetical protein